MTHNWACREESRHYGPKVETRVSVADLPLPEAHGVYAASMPADKITRKRAKARAPVTATVLVKPL